MVASSDVRVSTSAVTAAASAAFFAMAMAAPSTFAVLSSRAGPLPSEAAAAGAHQWAAPQLRGAVQTPAAGSSTATVASAVALTAVATVLAAALRRSNQRSSGFAGAGARFKSLRAPAVVCQAKKKRKEAKYKAPYQNIDDASSLMGTFTDYNTQKEAREQGSVGSILSGLEVEEREEDAAAGDIEDAEGGLDWNSDAGLEDQAMMEMSEEELARRGERQISYTLTPSRQYIRYIATKNAEYNWSKDEGRNKGCLEVQIAIMTERIRNMVMHMRENRHDFKCRLKLVSLVSRRRRSLDKLAWKDLNSYLKIRKALQIRHVYRMEALIGRVPRHKYGIRDRKRAPGRKTAMRLKKRSRLLQRRLASQKKQGKPMKIIRRTEMKIKSRSWISRPYDDVSAYIKGNDNGAPPKVDPLNIP
eukprot:TRINITY_DN629_c0_g1_i1.p1 TRINITY_DN629_c0_g1~~TRINITY_DN629_c0_g1_i1.p1  ORF type:complete len:417 (-),score=122.50 TRINITY_DN629_c0_g1_i1:195-1445(-)